MSDKAPNVLVITDDTSFAAPISEGMLRAGVQIIRFAQPQKALQLTHHFMPDLVLILMTQASSDLGQECYQSLRSDPALAAIPILQAAPLALAERAVGNAAAPQLTGEISDLDRLIGQISALLGLAPAKRRYAGIDSNQNENALPAGRADL